MRIQRIETKQGHPVPKSAHHPRGPFPPEMLKKPDVITDYQPLDDDIPVGGTAQNNYKEPKRFICKFCEELVYQHQIPDHRCDGIVNGTNS